MSTAIILAGGLGTRLRSVLQDTPKPMAPINGRPFLEYLMEYWIAQGIKEFIISVGYLRDQIMGHFGESFHGCPVRYSVEEVQLGTGGGVLAAMQHLNSGAPFLLLNGDTFFEVDLSALQRFHIDRVSDWTFSMFRANESGRYMRMQIDSECHLTDLVPTLGVEGALANGGVYLIDPEVLAASCWTVGDIFSLEADLIPNAFERGVSFFGFESHGRFIDIGVPRDYSRAPFVLRSIA